MSETTPPVDSAAPATAPTERRQGPPITVVMLDDEALILRLGPRVLKREADEVVCFFETSGDSSVPALVAKVREALSQGHHVVVLSDGSMPNGTTPLTVHDMLAQAGVLATRTALEAWIKTVEEGDETAAYPAGAPLVVVSGGISDPTLEKDVEAAIASGDIIGILGKPFNANQLRELVLGLATRDREVLLGTIEGIARTFKEATVK